MSTEGRSSKALSVPVRIVVPADPEGMAIGGIASFIRGFVKYAPPDFDVSMVGVTDRHPLWRWRRVILEERPVDFLPVMRHRRVKRSRLPLAARFVGALALRGRSLGTGVITSFHRPATDLSLRAAGPMWRVVHLGMEDLTTPGSESRWARLSRALERGEARSFARMDRIYVVNRRLVERYRERFPTIADRFRFLPNWVDQQIFHDVAPDQRRAWRAELAALHGFSSTAPLLLYAGRLDGQKDPLLLARAFAALRARRPEAHLMIAGEGDLEASLRGAIQSLGLAPAATFVGTVPRPDLARLMSAADVLVITSVFETGPTVGLEALACGLPVITTAVGEVSRVVAEARVGHVADGRDPDDLGRGIESVLGRRRDELRVACLAAAATFTAERVLGELYDYNRSLAARLRPG